MRNAQWLLTIFTLMFAVSLHATEMTDQIRAVIPDSITVQTIDERDGYVELNGIAATNQEISVLMRAVDQAGLGDPQLDSVRRASGVSLFRLRIMLRQVIADYQSGWQ